MSFIAAASSPCDSLHGLIGALPFLVLAAASILGLNEEASLLSGIAVIPIFFWELSLGLWLTVKGFKACAITDQLRAERTPPAYHEALA